MPSRYAGLALLIVLAPAAFAQAPSVAGLIDHLRHPDPAVRAVAGRALVARGPAVLADLAAAAGTDPSRAGPVEEVRRAIILVARLQAAKPTEVRYWLVLDDLLTQTAPHLRETALAAALPDRAATMGARLEAQATVDRFCRDWNEMYEPGSEEEKRYEALKAALVATGPAAAPHLLRILEADPNETFGNLHEERGVTARQQVRALFGVVFLTLREAAPYLVLHARHPSLTAASNAAAAFELLVLGKTEMVPLAEPDLAKIDAAFAERRAEFPDTTLRLARILATRLVASAAQSVVGPEDEERLAQEEIAGSLRLLTGKDPAFLASAAPEARLNRAREIEAALDAEFWR